MNTSQTGLTIVVAWDVRGSIFVANPTYSYSSAMKLCSQVTLQTDLISFHNWFVFLIKNTYNKKFIKTKSLYWYNKFKQYRAKLNHIIKHSKKSYYDDYFMNNTSNIKNIWRGIRKLITLKPMGSSMPSKILLNQTELTDSRDIANTFNDFFHKCREKSISDNSRSC